MRPSHSTGKIERSPVQTGGVVILRDKGRCVGNRHLDVGVDRFVETLHGPVARDRYRVPIANIIIRVPEALRNDVGIGDQRKVPITIQVSQPGRGGWIPFQERWLDRHKGTPVAWACSLLIPTTWGFSQSLTVDFTWYSFCK